MNIQKKSVFLALMSVFCLSIKAETSSVPYKLLTNTTLCLISSATTVTTIHHIALDLKRSPGAAFVWGIISIGCGYAAYRSGFSAYTSYKKACASKKSLHNSSDNTAPEKTLSSEEQNSSLKTSTQKATILGDTSL